MKCKYCSGDCGECPLDPERQKLIEDIMNAFRGRDLKEAKRLLEEILASENLDPIEVG